MDDGRFLTSLFCSFMIILSSMNDEIMMIMLIFFLV